jgi:hypothetical protein
VPAPEATGAHWRDAPGRGHYESYYLEAVRPGGGAGLWLRCTAGRAPAGPDQGAAWAAFVDTADEGPLTARESGLPLACDEAAWIRCGDNHFGEDGTAGSVRAGGHVLSWDLTYACDQPALFHLPQPWMYRARLPRTKLVSAMPAARVAGTMTVDGRTVHLDGWRGVLGHNWGEQHAHRWVWLHGVLEESAHAGSWLDIVIARVRVGGIVLPWTAFGAVQLDGYLLRVGGLGRRATVSASATRCSLAVTGAGTKVTASVVATAGALVRWHYEDPDGLSHEVTNSPTADLLVRIEHRGRPGVELGLDGCGVYEYGQPAA